MAKNKKSALNTDLDESVKDLHSDDDLIDMDLLDDEEQSTNSKQSKKKSQISDSEDIEDSLPVIPTDEDDLTAPVTEEDAEDDSIYTMGEIVVEENADENDDLRILQTGIKAAKKEEDDADEDDDESLDWEVDLDGSDPFLEDDDYDPEEDAYA